MEYLLQSLELLTVLFLVSFMYQLIILKKCIKRIYTNEEFLSPENTISPKPELKKVPKFYNEEKNNFEEDLQTFKKDDLFLDPK